MKIIGQTRYFFLIMKVKDLRDVFSTPDVNINSNFVIKVKRLCAFVLEETEKMRRLEL